MAPAPLTAAPAPRVTPRWERRLAVVLRLAVLATAVAHLARGELLLFAYSLLALGLIVTPPLLARSSGANVPIELELTLMLLLVCDITFGQLFGWYQHTAYWDKGLHLGNSVLLGFLGFIVLYVLLSTGGLRVSTPLAFLVVTCLIVGVGGIWEILEYVSDVAMGTRTQGSPTMGRLDDTMWDLILDLIGAAAGTLAGIVYMRGSRRALRVAQWFLRRDES